MRPLRRPGSNAVRLFGAFVAVAALVPLFAYQYHMYVHYEPPGGVGHYGLVATAWFLGIGWASAAAWGVATAWTGRVQSLTPARAVIAVILAPLPAAVDTFRRPLTDVAPPPRIAEWTSPSGPIDVVGRTLSSVGFWRLGAVLFLVAGVAWARRERRWLRGTALALVCYGGVHGAATTSVLHGMIFRPLVAALPGSVLFILGAVLAADTGHPDAESGDDWPPGVRATD
ncbi:hypothetical protein C475_10464 [Halosimplex carlsbadense 2-9-1]|uniref:Uncharacterized protein n=1 Tax=Halosimplex carlsbadense 2-9-1 TaxID=797114 RepID=M0CSS1_9EURY|nr:hypothetical protein [Halosimplex carlsbadense]ELZ25447.1 hypothetical protein C475_10464 [Halosimplex carlsbadense 2-9-1]